MKRAQLYNRILNNMYPTTTGKNIAAKAVDQEKIRLIHQEVKRLGIESIASVPALKVAYNAKEIAERSKSAAYMPVGLNTKTAQEIKRKY